MSALRRCCWCCTAVPLSVLVLLGALLLPQLLAPSKCTREEHVGTCTFSTGDAPAGCSGGVIIQLTGQPTLALRHFELDQELSLASFAGPLCQVKFAVACSKGKVEVRETRNCLGQSGSQQTLKPLNGTWGACAVPGAELRLAAQLIDASYGSETPPQELVHGCVEVAAADLWPELAAVRGAAGKQSAALEARRKLVGGCPTWRSSADALSRMGDFAVGPAPSGPLFALALKPLRFVQLKAVEKAARGESSDLLSVLATITFFAPVALTGVDTRTFVYVCLSACAEPQLMLGVQSFCRYRDVEPKLLDPTQKRAYKFGGADVSEKCFDQSLALFQSSGSAEHTQVRKLWDTVRFNTIHEGPLPDVATFPTWGWTSWGVVRGAREVLGLDRPIEAQVGQLVVPLILERLWGQKPSQEQLELFVQYLSFGALCIQGKVAMRLPIVPGKVAAIRSEMLKFALASPTGQAMARLLEQPEFSAVRRQYEARGRPAIEVALQNLADASMFAGVVGTTAMTYNCVKFLWSSSEHVRLFRRNSTTYLWELMRFRTVVGGSGLESKEDFRFNFLLKEVTWPKGGWTMLWLGGASGYDASVFADPFKFDPDRPTLGEMLSWNGKLKHAATGNYTSPRHCPGQRLSVKVAAHVCQYLTQHRAAAP